MATPTGACFHPGRATGRLDKGGDALFVFAADPPPFGVGAKRFSKHDSGGQGQQGPEYHVAYHEISSPPRWGTKGWPGIDDPIKRGRGTSTGRVYSSMAAPSAPPPSGSSLQPMFATYPNETRLQELLDLQRRKMQGVPPPGAYDVPVVGTRTTFRRPLAWDGPALHEGPSTRVKELASRMLAAVHTDVGPGEYEQGDSKEATSTLRSAPAVKIGSAAREGRTKHTNTLSISRSLQHGIDWHIPVIVQARPAQPKQATLVAAGGAGAGGTTSNGTVSAPQTHQGEAHASQPAPDSQHHRYMDPPSATPQQPGLPPAPPPQVARTRTKHSLHKPGDWNWENLEFNYKTSWTTLHGGAYQNGDRQPAWARQSSRSISSQSPGEPGNPLEAMFGPSTSSVDLDALPTTANSIFPIAEESSAVFREIRGSPAAHRRRRSPGTAGRPGTHASSDLSSPVQSPSVGLRSALPEADNESCQGFSTAASPTQSSPRRGLTSAQDLMRHTQAMQAAEAVQQVNARQSQWLARSGDFGTAPVPV